MYICFIYLLMYANNNAEEMIFNNKMNKDKKMVGWLVGWIRFWQECIL